MEELLHTYYTNRKVDKTWGINFKKINFNHTSVSSFYLKSIIIIENNFIKDPYEFLNILNREFLFLPEIKGQCSLYNSIKYNFVICNKDFDVNKFPKIEFYSDELNHIFILEGKDLFVFDEKNQNYIFLIIFDIHSKIQTGWELGLPFLRKYQIIFDLEEETLGIIDKKKKIKNNSFKQIYNVIIISFLLGIIFSYLFLLQRKKEKTMKFDELEEKIENNYSEK